MSFFNSVCIIFLALVLVLLSFKVQNDSDTQVAQAKLSQAHEAAILALQGNVTELYMRVDDLQAQAEKLPQETIVVTPSVVEKDQKVFFRAGWCREGSDERICGYETTPYYYHAEGGR